MPRPGSIVSRGIGMPKAMHWDATIDRRPDASVLISGASSSGTYAMPNPPPRSSSATCTPCSACTRAASSSTRCAATSNPPVSKICEPMCECSPANSSCGSAITRRTASSAAPEASEKPNFWSSCAVAMNSCVCASTPVVTRTRTRGRVPAASAW